VRNPHGLLYAGHSHITDRPIIAEPGMHSVVTHGERRFTVNTLRAASVRRFASVALDVDRYLTTIDGIDWLAMRRDELVQRRVAMLAVEARSGAITPERALAERLAAIRPRRDELHDLSRAYLDALVAGAFEAFARFRRAGVQVLIVSRGPRAAMYRLAYHLGIDARDVHGIDLRFDALGAYAGVHLASPLAGADGRRALVDTLDVVQPSLIVGDGATERPMDSLAHLVSLVLP